MKVDGEMGHCIGGLGVLDLICGLDISDISEISIIMKCWIDL